MCGIVGYVGPREALPILLDGLKRLEYRGYDSAGVAVLGDDGVVRVAPRRGKARQPRGAARATDRLAGRFGIGHTRWATHGRPSEENAHPHRDASGRIVVIHNGIIENFLPLKKALQRDGVPFTSETDTEVVAQALGAARSAARRNALRRGRPGGRSATLGGCTPLVLFSADEPGVLYAAKGGPPDRPRAGEGENFVASRRDGAPPPHARPRLPRGRRPRPGDGAPDRGDGPRRRAAPRPLAPRPVGRRRRREGGLPPLHGEGDRRAADGRRRDGRQQALARDGALRRGRDGGPSRRSSPASSGSTSSRAGRAGTRGSSGSSSSRRSRGSRPRSTTPRSSATGAPIVDRRTSSSSGSRSRARRPTRSRRSRRRKRLGARDRRRRRTSPARPSRGWSTASSRPTPGPRSASPRRRPSRRSSSRSPSSRTTRASRAAGRSSRPRTRS